LRSTFESAATEGWTARGGSAARVAVVSDDVHSGTYSLLTTGRTANWNGASINAAGKLCNGSRYTVAAWVKMAPGEPDTQLRVSIQRTFGASPTTTRS